jgi:hypothetical protein
MGGVKTKRMTHLLTFHLLLEKFIALMALLEGTTMEPAEENKEQDKARANDDHEEEHCNASNAEVCRACIQVLVVLNIWNTPRASNPYTPRSEKDHNEHTQVTLIQSLTTIVLKSANTATDHLNNFHFAKLGLLHVSSNTSHLPKGVSKGVSIGFGCRVLTLMLMVRTACKYDATNVWQHQTSSTATTTLITLVKKGNQGKILIIHQPDYYIHHPCNVTK